jgi:hypothetical protein
MKNSRQSQKYKKNASQKSFLSINWGAIQVLVAILAVIVALFALQESHKANLSANESNQIARQANDLAQQANKLIQDSQLSSIKIVHLRTIVQTYPRLTDPCMQTAGLNSIVWDREFIPAFDITNNGGVPTSLIGIRHSESRKNLYNTVPSLKGLDLTFSSFDSVDSYYDWLDSKQSGWFNMGGTNVWGGMESELTNITAAGVPLVIDPGHTMRLVIRGEISFTFDENSSPLEVRNTFPQDWIPTITFLFSDDTSVEVDTRVPFPYQWPNGSENTPDEYPSCN